MKKKISLILLFSIPLNIIILGYIFMVWRFSFDIEKIYYIQPADTYMKIYERDMYVAFGGNPDITLSDTTDYIKIYNSGALIFLNPENRDTIFINQYLIKNDVNKNIINVGSINGYAMDSLFFNRILTKASGYIYKLRSPYVCVYISEYSSSVYINMGTWDKYKELKPVNKTIILNKESFYSMFRWIMFWEKDDDSLKNMDINPKGFKVNGSGHKNGESHIKVENGKVTINYTLTFQSEIEVFLFGRSGKECRHIPKHIKQKGSYKEIIDSCCLKEGDYTLNFIVNGEATPYKFTVK